MKLQLPKNQLSQDVLRIAQAVATHKAHVMIIGGFVRDLLLGLKPKDADLEIYSLPYEHVKSLLQKLFSGNVKGVGKPFGVFKVHKKTYDIDVALPRTESKTGTGYHGFFFTSDPNLSIKDATRRRDFTINAILLDPLTGELIDPFKGQTDLKNRTLRAVNPKTFVEDPLRIYRAIQLVARFNLKVAPSTIKLMKQMVDSGELKHLSKERIRQELQKLYSKSADPALGLALGAKLSINAEVELQH